MDEVKKPGVTNEFFGPFFGVLGKEKAALVRRPPA
jgi:hypothetical protein